MWDLCVGTCHKILVFFYPIFKTQLKKLVQHFYLSSLFLQKAAAVNDPSRPVDYLRVIDTINDLAQSQEHQHDRTIEFIAQELALALLALDQDQGYRWDDQILFHFLNGR